MTAITIRPPRMALGRRPVVAAACVMFAVGGLVGLRHTATRIHVVRQQQTATTTLPDN